MDLQSLPDEVLAAQAVQWRTRALHGEKGANGLAHEMERELRRRHGVPPTLSADARSPGKGLAPRWAFWRR
ncbi:hypothetical protein [Variovorax sp. LARHSF232]